MNNNNRNRQMIKRIILSLVAVLSLIVAMAMPANAKKGDNPSNNDKVWVCKYSGEPTEGFKFKPGRNPIHVGAGSVKSGTFADAQPSIVLDWNSSKAPTKDDCPTPPGPLNPDPSDNPDENIPDNPDENVPDNPDEEDPGDNGDEDDDNGDHPEDPGDKDKDGDPEIPGDEDVNVPGDKVDIPETTTPPTEDKDIVPPTDSEKVVGPEKATIVFECLNPTQVKVAWETTGEVEFVNGYSPEARPLDGSDWIVAPGSNVLVETVLNNIGVSSISKAPDCKDNDVAVALPEANADPLASDTKLPVTGASSGFLMALGALSITLGTMANRFAKRH